MFASILSIFGPLAAQLGLSLINGVLQKGKADAAAQANFLAIVEYMSRNGLVSVNLHNSYLEQQAANRAKAAAEYYRLHPEEKPVDFPTPPKAQ